MSRRRLRVVVADDHAVVRDGLWRILDDEPDMEVVGAAATGREAVELAEALEPDVVVMDLAMPELDGVEATRRIRRERQDVQVVILSMHASAEHLHQSLAAGAIGYVVKSSAGTEVAAAVRAAAIGRSHVSEVLPRPTSTRRHRPAMAGEGGPLASLSPREREVLHLVVAGRSSREIADALGLSPGTVDTYRSRLMRKLGVGDLAGLVRFAVAHGLAP